MSRAPLVVALCALLGSSSLPAADLPEEEVTRRFFDGGPALLLPSAERERLAAASVAERAQFARDFLARDPDPTTPENELAAAVEKRRRQVLAEGLSLFDDRGRLLFLGGIPHLRTKVECAETYRPLEIWRFDAAPTGRAAVLVRQRLTAHYRAWRPTDSKRPLYAPEMEYLLEQFEELRGRIRGRRPDLQLCKQAPEVDRVTGVDGLFGFRPERMRDADVEALFVPPSDLAAWARAVLAPAADGVEPKLLPEPRLTVTFPERRDQRLLARIQLELPAGTALGAVDVDGGRESRLALDAALEREEALFDEWSVRFIFPPAAPESPIALELERPLRPRERFVLRLELRDELTGATAHFDRALSVPAEPTLEPGPTVARIVGREIGLTRLSGRDTVLLLPPVDDVLFGLWRAEAIVAGERIQKLVYYIDGKEQFARTSPPWTAELRLPNIPRETIVRVEGLDAQGKVVAADEVLVNEPQGEARVKLLAPPRGRRVVGSVHARAAVVTPEGKRVESVVFELNDRPVATLTLPPWEATIEIPSSTELTYLTVVAKYTDGTEVEDFRVLNSANFVEEVQVDLVELYATVTDRDGRLVEGLSAADFTIRDNDRGQTIDKFELVRDLPLTLGLVLDTSGSMREAMGEAKSAAQEFLTAVLTPRDRCFAVGFSERPALVLPLTSDAKALAISFRDLPALGATSLHDALVYSLYQFRGVRGRKAMVLLSDGDDTASLVPFADALAFAQRSGVSIYTIGLGISGASLGIRSKLGQLAAETGGKTYFVDKASELAGAYETIELELRSQYFLAFSPQPPPKEGERHTLAVESKSGKWRVRTARGYTP